MVIQWIIIQDVISWPKIVLDQLRATQVIYMLQFPSDMSEDDNTASNQNVIPLLAINLINPLLSLSLPFLNPQLGMELMRILFQNN